MMGFICMRNLVIALIAAASHGIMCRFEGILTCLIFRRTYDQVVLRDFPIPYAVKKFDCHFCE